MQLFPPLPPRSVLGGNIARALVALVLIVAVDQFTKWLVVEQMNLRVVKAIDFIPFLNFRMAWNPGVNFGQILIDGGEAGASNTISKACNFFLSL